jgi:hypothetical protein
MFNKLTYMKKYYAKHRKERAAYAKKWRAAHLAYIAKQNAKHYAAHHKQRIKKQRQYHAAHRKKCNEQSASYYTTHRAEASWRNMHVRCSRPTGRSAAYVNVKVCKRWSGPKGLRRFLKDMGPCPHGKSLSRFADTGDYKPSNCAWHTRKQQIAEHKKKARKHNG